MKRLLLVSQGYLPDPVSVGQHMADVAEEMSRRGWEVTVMTANRGYDDPKEKYLAKERIREVNVIRLPLSSLGKRTIVHRLVGQVAFCMQAALRGLLGKRPDAVLVTTSPPMGGVVGWLIGWLRGSSVTFWGMDLNPDQAIAQGLVSEKALLARVFEWFNRRLLRQATTVVALDAYMADSLQEKVAMNGKLHVLPPWPMEGYLELIEHDDNPFRKEHRLEGKFVYMYSGNHSPSHPLATFLESAKRLSGDDGIRFLFVGGGMGKKEVDEFIAREESQNVISLPYQALDQIKYSLSAADVHLVSMGEAMVGCVHPCKFYGALALGKPIFLIGPQRSHIGDVLRGHAVGWQIEHGDVDGAVQVLRACAHAPPEEIAARGATGRTFIREELSKEILCGKFCDLVEAGMSV